MPSDYSQTDCPLLNSWLSPIGHIVESSIIVDQLLLKHIVSSADTSLFDIVELVPSIIICQTFVIVLSINTSSLEKQVR